MNVVPEQIERWTQRPSAAAFGFAAALLIGAVGVTLYLMGQPLICTCGYVKLWHGSIDSGTSQHLLDWYSFSHVIHGFIFYGLLSLIAPNVPATARLLLAIIPEAGWEIMENTDAVIEHYREATISLDYYGDSVINAVFDILAMVVGFAFARFAPIFATLGLLVAFELAALYAIRDNLTLNVVMLLHSFEFIKEWQSAGGG